MFRHTSSPSDVISDADRPLRATRALVDLDAVAANVGYFRRLVSAGTRIVAVVKADGYGHGAVAVSKTALAAGASHLAVATVAEGEALRQAGVDAPVMLLGPIDRSEIGSALDASLTIALADRRFAELVGRVAAGRGGAPAEVQVKVDTGMRRFGADPREAVALAADVVATPALSLGGVFTHFADADGPEETGTERQGARFGA